MNNALLIVINVLASLFILFVLIQTVRVQRAMKKCEPVHKKMFRIRGTGKWWKVRIFIVFIILYIALYIFSIWYFDFLKLIWLYLSTLAGFQMSQILFRYGKMGKKGISIADTFIPWENIESCKLEWLPITHSFYPNGELTLTTDSHMQYVIIVDKKDEKAIGELLEKNNLVTPITTQK